MAQFHIGAVKYYDSKTNFIGMIQSKAFGKDQKDIYLKFDSSVLINNYVPVEGDLVIYSSDKKNVVKAYSIDQAIAKEIGIPWHEVIKYVGFNSKLKIENQNKRTGEISSKVSVKVMGEWILNVPPFEIQNLLRTFHESCEKNNSESTFAKDILHSGLQQIFLETCLSEKYISSIKDEYGANDFIFALDIIFRTAISELDYKTISTIIQTCDGLNEEYYKLIIVSCNELVTENPAKLLTKIRELNCFNAIIKNKKGAYDFRLEAYLSRGLYDEDFSFVRIDAATEADGLNNWFNSLSNDNLLSLAEFYPIASGSFQEAYIDFVLSNDFDGKNLIIMHNYTHLPDNQKKIVIKDYADNEHHIKEYFEEYCGDTFAAILCKDDFYQNHPELTIPSYNIVEGCVQQYIDLKEKFKVIREYSPECMKTSILKTSGANSQLSILLMFNLSKEDNYKFLAKEMPGTSILRAYGKQIAEEQINNFNYAVFDIEARKEKNASGEKHCIIKEAGFVSEKEEIHYPSNVSSLEEFFTKLSTYSIIVGHNVIKWDIGEVLADNGFIFDDSHYIWDTQIIQEILDPFMKCYALNNTSEDRHTALSDAKFTQKLFWNQIVTISEPDNRWIEGILPDDVKTIISIVRSKTVPQTIEKKIGNNQAYFKEMGKISKTISSEIKKVTRYESPLIIAPRSIWKIIREHIDILFNANTDDHLYHELDRERLSQVDVVDESTAILHSISISKRSNIVLCDIAPAVRQYFNKEGSTNRLYDFVKTALNEGALCTTALGFESLDESKKNNSDAIFFIGKELEARNNTNESRFRIPLSVLSTSISGLRIIKQFVESNAPRLIDATLFRELTGHTAPQFVGNIWIESATDDSFLVKSNRDFAKYQSHIASLFPNKVFSLDIKSKDYCSAPIYLLCTKQDNLDENASWDHPQEIQRLASTTKARGKYWAYQLALVASITRSKPLVWVIENREEISALSEAAKALGYYVPQNRDEKDKEDNGDIDIKRKVELAYESGKPEKSLIIIGGKEFISLLDSEIKDAYCLVYNSINIESKIIRWHNMLPFGDEPIKIGESPTQEDYVIATWPQLEVFNNLIHLNNPDCEFYLADPILDCCSLNSRRLNAEPVQISPKGDIFKKCEVVIEQIKSFVTGAMPAVAIDEEIAMKEMLEMFKDIKPNVTEWYPKQKEILPDIIKKEHNCLICMPTGDGKSILFQLPAMYRSKISGKLSIVIAPLKALLKDQVEDLKMPGVDYLNSDKSSDEVENIYQKIRGGEITLLYMTPERFRSQAFMNALGFRIKRDGGLEYIIFDEAHCISQWGLDFRPDYRYAAEISNNICEAFPDVKVELFTATVTKNVREDIASIIPIPDEKEHKRYNPIRDHIGMEFSTVQDDPNAKSSKDDVLSPREKKRVELLYNEIVNSDFDPEKSTMIIFSTTHKQVENFKDELSKKFSDSSCPRIKDLAERIECFHGGMTTEERDDIYRKFKGKDKKTGEGDEREYSILVATKAFGMGMNIPDIHYVYHAFPSENIEDYLQEIGRAGRDDSLFPEGYGSKENGLKQFVTKCFVSEEDVKHSKELQLKSSLKWDEVRDIYASLKEYISKFSEDGNAYISVPSNIWKRVTEQGIKDDPTAFKIGLHWLAEAGRINTRFLTTATYDFKINEDYQTRYCPNTACEPIVDFLSSKIQLLDNFPQDYVQIRISEIKKYCHLRQNELNDLILESQKYQLIELTNKVSFNFSNWYRKHGLSISILNDIKPEEFSMPFLACRSILDNLKVSNPIVKNDRNRLINELLSGSKFEKRNNSRKNEKRKEASRNNEISRLDKIAFKLISKLSSVVSIKELKETDDWILDYSPSPDWNEEINSLEDDSFALLKYLNEISFEADNTINEQESENRSKQKIELPTFTWTDAAIKIGASSYKQIETAVEIIKALGLASIDSLLPTGTEVRLTSNRDDLIPVTLDPENINNHSDGKVYTEFIQVDNIRQLKLVNIMALSKVPSEHFDEAIKDYFDCSAPEDFLKWSQNIIDKKWLSNDDATMVQNLITQYKAEDYKKLMGKLNEEQKAVCDYDKDKDLVVLAGPGSGKTHVLTVRCAKMLRDDKVNRDDVLVLAYNRGVVSELRTRLGSVFFSLGYTRSMSRIKVFTFHSFVKRLDYLLKRHLYYTTHQEFGELSGFLGTATQDWESELSNYLSDGTNFRTMRDALLGSNFKATYFLVDEFQDVTDERLDVLFLLRELMSNIPGNTKPKFFVVGDINQSIYGYQRIKKDQDGNNIWEINGEPVSISPQKYYQKLRERLDESNDLKMTLNYRSYEAILQKAVEVLNSCSAPYSSSIESALKEQRDDCVFDFDSEKDSAHKSWDNDFKEIIEDIQGRGLHEIAFLFRTNAELYAAYSKLREILCRPEWSNKKISVRIQGNTESFFRTRECYLAIYHLLQLPENTIIDKQAFSTFLQYIASEKSFTNSNGEKYLDKDAVDLTYAIALSCYDALQHNPTARELADEIMDTADESSTDLLKIKENYKTQIIGLEQHDEEELIIIFSVMHRVKGLEFEAVVVNPSKNPIGFERRINKQVRPWITEEVELPQNALLDALDEERRLLYVAYTRAKYYLRIYKGEREIQLLSQNTSYRTDDNEETNLVRIESGLDKYNIGYGLRNVIRHDIKKNSPMSISRGKDIIPLGDFEPLGQLAGMYRLNENCTISGLYLNDMYVWRYEDTLRVDANKNTSYADAWPLEKRHPYDYILVPDISGMGIIDGE